MKQKRLRKQLGTGYFFEQRLSAAVVANLLETLDGSNHFLIAASLAVGAVKLEAVVYWNNGKYSLGILLSARTGSVMRICLTPFATTPGIWSGRCFWCWTGRWISMA